MPFVTNGFKNLSGRLFSPYSSRRRHSNKRWSFHPQLLMLSWGPSSRKLVPLMLPLEVSIIFTNSRFETPLLLLLSIVILNQIEHFHFYPHASKSHAAFSKAGISRLSGRAQTQPRYQFVRNHPSTEVRAVLPVLAPDAAPCMRMALPPHNGLQCPCSICQISCETLPYESESQ